MKQPERFPFPCETKASFSSARDAHKACRKNKRLSGVSPYRCQACGQWHLGRTLKPIR